MRRTWAIIALATMTVGACGGSSSSDERVVLVDYSPDDAATFVAQNFPAKVAIHPGDTVVFKQTWTGEPHTVTGGRAFNGRLQRGKRFLDLFVGYDELRADNPNMVFPDEPGDATFVDFVRELRQAKPEAKVADVIDAYKTVRKDYPALPDIDNPQPTPFLEIRDLIESSADKAFGNIPFAWGDNDELKQNIGQPCFLQKGLPPEDDNTPCSQRRQPVFDGTASVYNSGVLPYEGPRGNTYRVKFAPDTKPGNYFFYCAIHGLGQLSEIVVKPTSATVPSASAVARQGRAEADATVKPLLETYRTATRTGAITWNGETVKGPFAGLPSPIHGAINEFVPRTIKAKAGEAITWKIMGADHTISFDVPSYLPIVEFGAKRFRLNPKTRNVAGGSPPLGEGPDEGIWRVDGGTYDGTGFWSSGLFGGEPYAEYTLRISKPGTYPYACLVHPKMIGKVVIT